MGASKSRSLGRGPPTDAEWTPPPATPDTLPLTHLCEDALLEIMRHCGIRDLGRLAQTCIFFDELLRNRAGLLWARKANAAFGTLDRRWRNLALRDCPDPATELGSVEVGVWSCGVNQGPSDWGVPTPPDFSSNGQLGLPDIATDSRVRRPTLLPTLRGRGKAQPCEVATGGFHTVFLMSDGTVMSCGSGVFGQTGQATRNATEVPKTISLPPGHRIVSVHCGFAFTMLRTAAGKVLACGFNQNGRLGVSDAKCERLRQTGESQKTQDGDHILVVPTEIDAVSPDARIRTIACGSGHTIALLESGEVVSWGRGEQGQLGDGHGTPPTQLGAFSVRVDHSLDQYKATPVRGLPPIKAIACGSYFSAALSVNGEVYIWGGVNGWRISSPMRLETPEPIDRIFCSSMLLIMVPTSSNIYMIESQRDDLLSAIATRGDGNEQVDCGVAVASIGAQVWRMPLPIGSEGPAVRDVACDAYSVLVLLSSGRLLMWGYSATRQVYPEFYAVLPAQPTTRVCRIAFGCQHLMLIAMHSHGAIANFQKDRYTLWPVLPAAPLF